MVELWVRNQKYVPSPAIQLSAVNISYFCSITETIAIVINLIRDFVIKVD
jgi:hypothetical protein